MGLDSFKSDDSGNSGNASSSNNSSSNKVKIGTDQGHDTKKPGAPTNTHQLFKHDGSLSPRDIKYEVKSYCPTYVKQFSTSRSDSGELVMYSAGRVTHVKSKTVAIFTSIKAFDDEPPFEDELDIKIVPWDLDNKEPLTEPQFIQSDDDWRRKIGKVIESAKNYIREDSN
jgi:hypothetical protein